MKAICTAVIVAIIAGLMGVILRLTWKAAREKAARQAQDDAHSILDIQAKATQAATDADNTDAQLNEALSHGTF